MLAPAVAATRTAVRRALRHLDSGGLVLVACSGGADSLALAVATGFVAPRLGWRAGLVTVDHQLQPGASDRAEAVASWARERGLAPVAVLPVTVAGRPGGPEAAARSARYEALAAAARQLDAAAVLLGHTRDDQAETVLLALARGAGPRGLAGMPAVRLEEGAPLTGIAVRGAPSSGKVAWLRPFLDLTRAQTRDACRALDLDWWDDPHNTDPAYARARVRATALPALVEALGDRVVGNLARTAGQLAADNAALDALAAAALAAARTPDGLAVSTLRQHPDAVRTRALHAWARELGAAGSALSHRHVAALDALVTDWHGQGPVHLPGGITVQLVADLGVIQAGSSDSDLNDS